AVTLTPMEGSYELLWSLRVGAPIVDVVSADWDGDGVTELVVATSDDRLFGVAPMAVQGLIESPADGSLLPSQTFTLTGTVHGASDAVLTGLPGGLEVPVTVEAGQWTATVSLEGAFAEPVSLDISLYGTTGGWNPMAPSQQTLLDTKTYWLDPVNDFDQDGVPNAEDCPESGGHEDPEIFPGNPEICDGVDNDCDGETDEGVIAADPCDGVDNDCDGETDEDESCADTCALTLGWPLTTCSLDAGPSAILGATWDDLSFTAELQAGSFAGVQLTGTTSKAAGETPTWTVTGLLSTSDTPGLPTLSGLQVSVTRDASGAVTGTVTAGGLILGGEAFEVSGTLDLGSEDTDWLAVLDTPTFDPAALPISFAGAALTITGGVAELGLTGAVTLDLGPSTLTLALGGTYTNTDNFSVSGDLSGETTWEPMPGVGDLD
ncbi:MAG: putative metal-binding motif-containing protein, partial [Myxococcota bacterium]|nr:putative metal-binding motif-containing protein [Myxococcota bacterium]